jgi:hypothetical protein
MLCLAAMSDTYLILSAFHGSPVENDARKSAFFWGRWWVSALFPVDLLRFDLLLTIVRRGREIICKPPAATCGGADGAGAPVGVCGFPPLRQEKGARMGHPQLIGGPRVGHPPTCGGADGAGAPVGVRGFPPLRQEKGARMGHPQLIGGPRVGHQPPGLKPSGWLGV